MLGGLENGMLWSSLGLSLLDPGGRCAPRPRPLAARGAAGDPRRRDLRQRAARLRGRDRCGGRRAGHGAAARAARPRRLVPPDRAQRPAEPRLDDLRSARHRHRRAGARARAALRSGNSSAAAAATILALLGPIGFVRVWVKRVALWVVLASLAYLTWWTLRDANLGALWSQPGTGGLSFSAGSRPHGRDAGSSLAARRRLHPLFAEPSRRVPGSLGRLLHPERVGSTRSARSCSSHAGCGSPSVITAIATRGVGAALALVALGVDETKEPSRTSTPRPTR